MKTYLISWAQNATPVHAGFWQALLRCSEHRDAQILVIGGRYRNPTSRWSSRQETDEWWADEITPLLVTGRLTLSRNLRVYGDISIQPTASRPLSGFEVFLGARSGIFGHPKRALEVVPTGTRRPRVMWTTGACTVSNYTPTKAGAKGRAHHVLGAVIVEVEDSGRYFVRHLSANSRGEFTDLDTRYTPNGFEQAPPAASLTLGDWHSGRVEEHVIEATRELADLVRPKYLVLHDVLDFSTRNHHDRSARARYVKRFGLVESEVRCAAADLQMLSTFAKYTRVVRANHDTAFERWLEEFRPNEDPGNVPYYHEMWARAYRHQAETGAFPDLFEMESRRFGVPECVQFLKLNESLRIGQVEHGFHGHIGSSGSRGSTRALAKLGVKVTKGHDHTPTIMDGCYSVGVSAALDHGYNSLPSTWMQAHVLQYADGKRVVVFVFDGAFRGA